MTQMSWGGLCIVGKNCPIQNTAHVTAPSVYNNSFMSVGPFYHFVGKGSRKQSSKMA